MDLRAAHLGPIHPAGLAVLALALHACGGSESASALARMEETREVADDASAEAPAASRDQRRRRAAAEAVVVALPAEPGVLRGAVLLKGTPPPRKEISMGAVAGCEGHAQPVLTEAAIVTDGRVQNAVVWIKKGIAPDSVPAPPAEPAVLDQKGCLYVPHVMAVRAGQKFLVRNGDQATHNVNARPERAKNKAFNHSQPANSPDIEVVFPEREVAVRFGCDMHPWMNSWVAVLDHPYFAISGPDGSWSIPGLAPGSYELEVWHETFGRESAELTLSAEDGARADFTYVPR